MIVSKLSEISLMLGKERSISPRFFKRFSKSCAISSHAKKQKMTCSSLQSDHFWVSLCRLFDHFIHLRIVSRHLNLFVTFVIHLRGDWRYIASWANELNSEHTAVNLSHVFVDVQLFSTKLRQGSMQLMSRSSSSLPPSFSLFASKSYFLEHQVPLFACILQLGGLWLYIPYPHSLACLPQLRAFTNSTLHPMVSVFVSSAITCPYHHRSSECCVDLLSVLIIYKFPVLNPLLRAMSTSTTPPWLATTILQQLRWGRLCIYL